MGWLSSNGYHSANSITSWLVTFVIGLVTFHLVRQWMRVRKLPPGPFPLPVLGNLLVFRAKRHITDVVLDIAKDYEGIFTLWMGAKPFVMVTDWNLVKEGLIASKKNDFISRPNDMRSMNHIRHILGIVFEPNDRNWEVSRKVGSGAVRKFADAERLASIVRKGTDELILKMLGHEGKPFDPASDFEVLTINILSDTAFGIGCLNNEDYKKMQRCLIELQKLSGNTPGDFSVLLLLIFYARDQQFKNRAKELGDLLSSKYRENKETFKKGVIRNFSDAVITAGVEAEEEESDAKAYLSEANMIKIVGALFLAGTETTIKTLKWIILFVAYFSDVQRKILEEIEEHIGTKMVVQSDRLKCPYTWAVISETLRCRAILGLGLPHIANVNTELGGYKILKGTLVNFVTEAVHTNNAIWEEARSFKPERFLNADGSYNHDTRRGFLTFGEGKRICIGEKLARNDLFLILVNLLQHVQITLDSTATKDCLAPDISFALNQAKPYKIIVSAKKRCT